MKKFNNAYKKIINEIKFGNLQTNLFNLYDHNCKCIYESIIFKNIINEMNDNVFPIPKQLLSFYVKEVYENGFQYVSEYSMKKVIEDTKNSENFNILKIDMKKLELTKNKSFLFICLPYKINIWEDELKTWFSNTEIEKVFKDFNNSFGVSGTYHSGFLMIINSDFLQELKDIEEVVEHEFVHMFEGINGEENEVELSFDLLSIVRKPSEFKTYKINLMNRLDKIYNKYCIKFSINDTKENRKNFLDKMFEGASDLKDINLFINYIKTFDSSYLVESNMYFLWNMIHWKTKEYDQFKKEVYDHMLN